MKEKKQLTEMAKRLLRNSHWSDSPNNTRCNAAHNLAERSRKLHARTVRVEKRHSRLHRLTACKSFSRVVLE